MVLGVQGFSSVESAGVCFRDFEFLVARILLVSVLTAFLAGVCANLYFLANFDWAVAHSNCAVGSCDNVFVLKNATFIVLTLHSARLLRIHERVLNMKL